jgi:hypothetical protein
MVWERVLPAAGIVLLLAGATSTLAVPAPAGDDGQSRDINGRVVTPFAPAGKAHVLFFVATDCPVSNSYAPEIQRICKAYEPRGVACSLAYEDVAVDGAAVRKHMDAFGYRTLPATIDTSRALADRARASITPEAVVVDARGQIRYRGRIDNLYSSLGKPRQQITMHDLTDALDAVVAGKQVTRAETEAVGCFIARPAPVRK